MTEEEEIVKLAKIITNNPGAVAYIDNDAWYLYKPLPTGYDDWPQEEQDEWYGKSRLACSDDFALLGNSYGYGLLEAMAHIHNIKLEEV